ncbi:transcriptional regulator NanR [Acuticoccus sp. M5D2P5]|uniref:transcriptional regulator NanR n=1 Tax=Acuticoccus kalidii TaxID=2910977 RepID=UPI001F466C41|nr:transcriptional regulator NanR [Acuticoccus kalidii]MCF3936516.1 transcriptional regulator NanR [Acuticoccus kalidii]
MMEGTPIQRRKLSDDVFDRVLDMIKDGTLKPGDSLPSERSLMESLGVGRPAVREALQALARMGLIEIKHGERARVSEPSFGHMVEQIGETMRHLLVHSPADLEHLKEARATLEREIARIAARKRTESDMRRLWSLIDQQESASREPARFRALDGLFHREIASISGNPIWPAVSEAVFGWLNHFHVDLVAVPGLEQLTIAEHRQIADAIERRDPEAAGQAMADHLNRANELYRRAHLPQG